MGAQCSTQVSRAIPDRETMLGVVDALEKLDLMLAANAPPSRESKKQVKQLNKIAKAVTAYQHTLKTPELRKPAAYPVAADPV